MCGLAANREVHRVGDEAEMMRAVVQRLRECQVAACLQRHAGRSITSVKWPPVSSVSTIVPTASST